MELSSAWNSGTKLGAKQRSKVAATIDLAKNAEKYTPGEYTLRVLFNGKVFKEIPVTLVNP
jgi:hypothetical protein